MPRYPKIVHPLRYDKLAIVPVKLQAYIFLPSLVRVDMSWDSMQAHAPRACVYYCYFVHIFLLRLTNN